MAVVLQIHPLSPQNRLINQAVACLQQGGVLIYPTDTLYALGCSMLSKKGLERIARIKGIDPAKALLSFVCHDLSDLSQYARQLDTPRYRLLKSHLPGPYTFILPASKQVPKLMQSKKSTIGLRVPNNPIAREIARALGVPVLSASVPQNTGFDFTDPEILATVFEKQVDLVIDGGPGFAEGSTIVDLTGDQPELIRQGLGVWNE